VLVAVLARPHQPPGVVAGHHQQIPLAQAVRRSRRSRSGAARRAGRAARHGPRRRG
jgi:hypothetical protein